MINHIKSFIFLSLLSGLFIGLGYVIGNTEGMTIAFIMAIVFNGLMYYFSDSIVLRMYNAQEMDKQQYGWIYQIVQELSSNMAIPMPRVWYVRSPMANAFATGRNPQHASIALTSGIMEILDRNEIRAVIAHELSHVKNRDTLLTTLAATMGAAIGYLCNMMLHLSLYRRRDDSRNNSGVGFIALLALSIFVPIIATLLRLALSRSREFLADETGAHACHDPLALASALKKLQAHTQQMRVNPQDTAQESMASLFIVNPFTGSTISTLFSTHPPLHERVKALENIHTKFF